LSALLALVLIAQTASDRSEHVTDTPEYRGVHASAPIPPELHIRNEGGSDGAGLCVISSILANGAYQGVPGLDRLKDSTLWRTAKSRPGGYYPGKLEALLKQVLPGERWFSWEGPTPELVAEYSKRGYPVAATMNTGELYNWQSIHHMISIAHLDDSWACVVDNNDPGKYHWMTAAEYARRFPDGGQGWGFVWLRVPGRGDVALLIPAIILFTASGGVLLIPRRGREVSP
jgi:hypothetical protein